MPSKIAKETQERVLRTVNNYLDDAKYFTKGLEAMIANGFTNCNGIESDPSTLVTGILMQIAKARMIAWTMEHVTCLPEWQQKLDEIDVYVTETKEAIAAILAS